MVNVTVGNCLRVLDVLGCPHMHVPRCNIFKGQPVMDEVRDDLLLDACRAQSLADFAGSEMFLRIYDDVMRMVSEAAEYLELDAVIERKRVQEKMAPVFACESMRLTTRLMQVTAWLLAMRAVKGGELTREDFVARNYRLGSREVCLGGPVRGAGLLPPRLIELLGVSKLLYERVLRLDEQVFSGTGQQGSANPVGLQRNRIEQAFSLHAKA